MSAMTSSVMVSVASVMMTKITPLPYITRSLIVYYSYFNYSLKNLGRHADRVQMRYHAKINSCILQNYIFALHTYDIYYIIS